MDLNAILFKFDSTVSLLVEKKRNDNDFFFNHDEYCERIEEIKQSNITLFTTRKKKCTKDYRNYQWLRSSY